MSPVSYLVIAAVVGLVGIAVLVSMNRAPRRPDFAMEEFRREMQALAPRPTTEATEPTEDESTHDGIGPVTEPEER